MCSGYYDNDGEFVTPHLRLGLDPGENAEVLGKAPVCMALAESLVWQYRVLSCRFF